MFVTTTLLSGRTLLPNGYQLGVWERYLAENENCPLNRTSSSHILCVFCSCRGHHSSLPFDLLVIHPGNNKEVEEYLLTASFRKRVPCFMDFTNNFPSRKQETTDYNPSILPLILSGSHASHSSDPRLLHSDMTRQSTSHIWLRTVFLNWWSLDHHCLRYWRFIRNWNSICWIIYSILAAKIYVSTRLQGDLIYTNLLTIDLEENR